MAKYIGKAAIPVYTNTGEITTIYRDISNSDYVEYTQEQNLTEAQKERARNNIGVSDLIYGLVRYDTEQTLTEAQKLQARENINANIKIGALSNTSTFHCSYPTTMDMDFRVAGRSKFSGGVDASTLLKTKKITLNLSFTQSSATNSASAAINPDSGWTPICIAAFDFYNIYVLPYRCYIDGNSVRVHARYYGSSASVNITVTVSVLLLHTG